MDGNEEVCRTFVCAFALGVGRAVRVYLILLRYHFMANNSDMGKRPWAKRYPTRLEKHSIAF